MIPAALLNSLYTVGSLKVTNGGVEFAIKNRLAEAEVVGISWITIDGQLVAMDDVRLALEGGRGQAPAEVSAANPIPFPLRCEVKIHAGGSFPPRTRHKIEMAFETRPFGKLQLDIEEIGRAGAGSRRF